MKSGKKYIEIHQELIDSCRQNDRTAQIKVYELYYKAMYNTSYRILNNSAEAEDIMQEAFLDAFRKLDTFKGEAPFGSWLKKIVVNKSLDAIKKKKLFTRLDDEQYELEDTTESHGTDEETMYRIEAIRNAMEKLPDHYRIILSLFLLEGYDHQEIAEVLKISYNNVRIRYMRARQKLITEVQSKNMEYMNSLKN